ncbi:MAG: glutamine synthetase [Chromatiales bacterium]|nr:hypothetical protein [Gammaproteobacteria bacterium]MBW6476152.1 glutamine synthetase [Chromatiales bacterium]
MWWWLTWAAGLEEATDCFGQGPFVIEALGQELRDEFIRYKPQEWTVYHQTISDWGLERYSLLGLKFGSSLFTGKLFYPRHGVASATWIECGEFAPAGEVHCEVPPWAL